jgi:hypothetical protein
VIGLLLTSYIFVGAVAHLESMGRLFEFDSKPAKVEQGRPAQPIPARVYWTQHKHVPSFTKAVPFSPVLVAPCDFPDLERFSPLFVPENIDVAPFLFTIRTFSRAPPLPAVIS